MDDAYDDDEDWSEPLNIQVKPTNLASATNSCELTQEFEHRRTIIHFDIDCFYAQVEMILNPELRTKPLGIQQKNIVVTCNYLARERGVSKLMYLTDAKKKCPEMVLVSGEDLTKYRHMSFQISEFLQKYSPVVERLGFDENFVDVTDLVTIRMKNGENVPTFVGHVYGNQDSPKPKCSCGCEQRIQIGSHIAFDIREALEKEMGITCCAGVGHNKLLAKLVAGTHKPNQQTSILPHRALDLLSSLPYARSIPGIGSAMSKRLLALNISSVRELQEANRQDLEQEFGPTTAQNLIQLSHGIDNSQVVTYGQPQTISDEDSFKCCDSFSDAQRRMKELLLSLLQRLDEDGRIPQTIRLTIRKAGRGSNQKESRQCPVQPDSFLKYLQKDSAEKAQESLLTTVICLFRKLIDTSKPFHLTLINICFAKLVKPGHEGQEITSFFKGSAQKINSQKSPTSKSFMSQNADVSKTSQQVSCSTKSGPNTSVHRQISSFFTKSVQKSEKSSPTKSFQTEDSYSPEKDCSPQISSSINKVGVSSTHRQISSIFKDHRLKKDEQQSTPTICLTAESSDLNNFISSPLLTNPPNTGFISHKSSGSQQIRELSKSSPTKSSPTKSSKPKKISDVSNSNLSSCNSASSQNTGLNSSKAVNLSFSSALVDQKKSNIFYHSPQSRKCNATVILDSPHNSCSGQETVNVDVTSACNNDSADEQLLLQKLLPSDIDASTLCELPEDIQMSVLAEYGIIVKQTVCGRKFELFQNQSNLRSETLMSTKPKVGDASRKRPIESLTKNDSFTSQNKAATFFSKQKRILISGSTTNTGDLCHSVVIQKDSSDSENSCIRNSHLDAEPIRVQCTKSSAASNHEHECQSATKNPPSISEVEGKHVHNQSRNRISKQARKFNNNNHNDKALHDVGEVLSNLPGDKALHDVGDMMSNTSGDKTFNAEDVLTESNISDIKRPPVPNVSFVSSRLKSKLPDDIDPDIFSELPNKIQGEIMAHVMMGQSPTSQVSTSATLLRTGKRDTSKQKAKNTLFSYFKKS